jgi:enoyl-CoA hydratase
VHSYCLAGGTDLMLACDLAVAADDAYFGYVDVRFGSGVVSMLLPWIVGVRTAKELVFTGEDRIPADEALRIGLVNRVVPKEKLLEECEALLRKMLANGPVSLRFTLEAVNAGLELPLAQAQYLEATLFGLICTTEDMKEGTRAFLEKRPAKFEGR